MQVLHVNVGAARETQINGRKLRTAIAKQPAPGAVRVHPLGLDGDEQADLSRARWPEQGRLRLPAGTLRVLADGARTGPRGAVGRARRARPVRREPHRARACWKTSCGSATGCSCRDCVLAVSEPRFPCFKFNAAMGFNQAAKLMVQSGFCGSYLAVIEPGTVARGRCRSRWCPGRAKSTCANCSGPAPGHDPGAQATPRLNSSGVSVSTAT